MSLKWFLRNILLNLVLFSIMIAGFLVHLGYIDMLTPAQVEKKGQETLYLLHKEGCLPDKKLQSKLDLNFIQYTRLRKKLQIKRLMLHYDCGFKNTPLGKIHVRYQDPPRIQEYPQAKPTEAQPAQFSQEALNQVPPTD
jgi:hypothetical protein